MLALNVYVQDIMVDVLVFGKNGQIARALGKILNSDAIFLGQDAAHFQQPESLTILLNKYQPKVVINTAAYTAVDKAESEKDLCFKINAEAPKVIAAWCQAHESLLLQFSTDYVYKGIGDETQSEETAREPVNTYGISKSAAEDFIRESGARHIIFRTSWVYDEQGTNFVRTMLRLASEKEELKVVSDQIGSPTYAGDLALAIKKILSQDLGNIKATYNIAGTGFVSWYEFAQQIFLEAKKQGLDLKIKSLLPIETKEYKTAAPRPLNSRMNQKKIKEELGIELPRWQDSLQKYFEQYLNKDFR